jgi:putative Holliday junction resolvase
VRLGVDVGKARVGIARSDPHGMMATPVETIARDLPSGSVGRVVEIVNEFEAFEVIVGLPLNMLGERTLSTEDAVGFAEDLAAVLAPQRVSVRLVDERLSTVSAQSQLRQAGKRTKQSKHIIDQAAAVVILQHALDIERARDEAAGTKVEPNVGPQGEDSPQ